MFVRLLIEEDFPAVIEMARMNAAETRPELEFSASICRDTLRRSIETANPTIFVAEHHRELVGFLMASWFAYSAFTGFYTVQEVLFVRPVKRGSRAAVLLMKHFVDWSIRLGASEMIGGNDNDFQSERTARFLEHFEFKRVGYAMRRDLTNGRQERR